MDSEHCYRVACSRDGRFDGMFVTAVRTTHIYCRPSCPAVTPKRGNVVFYPTPAAAQEAGFRACKRCRPDAAPGSPEWDRRGDAVARAVRMIDDGVIEREGVTGLARRIGYSPRHLHRIMVAELGTGPLQLSVAHRVSNARALLETSSLSVTDVALASGFGSVRQFNDLVRRVYGYTPGDLRRRASGPEGGLTRGDGPSGLRQTVTARLSLRSPIDLASLFGFLARRTVPGVEHFGREGYSRIMRLPRALGVVSVALPEPAVGSRPITRALTCSLELGDMRDYPAAVARVRRMLDLDADPVAVDSTLREDPAIRALIDARPGLRLAGAVDGSELAFRAVLGQQVSVASANVAAGRLAAALGERLPHPSGPLRYAFPTPESLADADWDEFPMPRERARTIRALARAICEGEVDLGVGADREGATAALGAIKGIGPWTAGYIRMRALGDPDVFLGGDGGVRRALSLLTPPVTGEAGRWKPWSSYAVAHLWASLGGRSASSTCSPGSGQAQPVAVPTKPHGRARD